MRLFVLCSTVLLAATLTSCGSYSVVSNGGYHMDKTGEKRSREDSGALPGTMTAVEVDHRFGSVTVVPATGAPDYSWTLSCWGRTVEEADRFLEEITLVRTEEGGTQRFRLVLPEDPGSALRGVESHLTLRLPDSAEVSLRNEFGDVEVHGIDGRVSGECSHCSVLLEDLAVPTRFRTSFDDLRVARIAGGVLENQHGELVVENCIGDLEASTSFDDARITGVRGSLRAKNSHGSLEIGQVEGTLTAETSFAAMSVEGVGGAATLRNSHGGIRAREVSGELDAKTSFAPVDLTSRSERVTVENSHGAIDLAVLGTALRHLEAETSFADLTLRLPAGARPAISVDHAHGDVSCPIPVTLSGRTPELDAGAARVHLKVRHGDIRVTQGNEQ